MLSARGEDAVRYVTFNQDHSALCVGCNSGFKLFSLSNIEKLDETFYEGTLTNVVIVERLYLSSLVVTVSQNTPRRLSLCHFKKGTEICNYSYPNRVLSVKLNRKRLVVCLVDSLYIHNIKDMKVVHTIKETPDNPRGVCTLCSSDDCGYLAYPGSSTMGEVQVFDAHHLVPVVTIPAHDNPLTAMSFNRTGDRLATASDKGTVIRVFSMPEGNKMFEFRRGVKRCVTIYSLAFSNDSLLLACCSNTETIHIFKLESASASRGYSKSVASNGPHSAASNPSLDDNSNSRTWIGYFGQAILDSASYLPTNVGEMFTQGRAAFQARIPFFSEDSTYFNTCALTWINKILRLVVASTSGQLYMYNVDLSDSTGECPLIRQHKIDGSTGLGVGGSRKSNGSNNNISRGSNSSPLSENSKRVSGASNSRSNSATSFDYAATQNNVVTTEDSESPLGGVDIPPSPIARWSEFDERDPKFAPSGAPLAYPYTAPVVGSFGSSLNDRQGSSPGSNSANQGGVTYAGMLGTSPSGDRNLDDVSARFKGGIKIDDENEFPPMTMHTDD